METCRKCGYLNRDGQAVCIKCGHEVTAPYEAASTTARSTKLKPLLAVFALLCLMIAAASAIVLSSASKSSTTASTASATRPTRACTPAGAGAAPAIAADNNRTYSFQQLVKRFKVVSKSGVAPHYVFRYRDREGVMKICDLPSSAAQGRQTLGAWAATFQAYSLSTERIAGAPTQQAASQPEFSRGGASPPSAMSQAQMAGIPQDYLPQIANLDRMESGGGRRQTNPSGGWKSPDRDRTVVWQCERCNKVMTLKESDGPPPEIGSGVCYMDPNGTGSVAHRWVRS
jgi:hypothetical protein